MLHGRDVLATTVLQTCIRYLSRTKTCQFCAIGQSLAAGRTIERKTPAQLGEVAKAAVSLDGVKHMVMTTGTPPGRDRGAAILCESAAGVKAAVNLPIQVQCEPPDDDGWFARMRESGADALGMHLEAVTEPVRHRIMPGNGAGLGGALFLGFRGGGAGLRAGAGLDLYPRRAGRHARGDPFGLRTPRGDRRLSLRRALRADLGHAARKPSDARARLHERHPAPARPAAGWRAA